MPTIMNANPYSSFTIFHCSLCVTASRSWRSQHWPFSWAMAIPTLPVLLIASVITLGLAFLVPVAAFVTTSYPLQIRRELLRRTAGVNRVCQQERCGASAVSTVTMAGDGVAEVKSRILQLAAVMDRGGMANPGERIAAGIVLKKGTAISRLRTSYCCSQPIRDPCYPSPMAHTINCVDVNTSTCALVRSSCAGTRRQRHTAPVSSYADFVYIGEYIPGIHIQVHT